MREERSKFGPLKGLSAISIRWILILLTSPSVSSAATLTARVTCSKDPSANCGIVEQSAVSCKRNCIITIHSIPYANWRFDHWEGDASGSANPTTVRMTADKMVTAVFVSTTTPPPTLPPQSDQEVVGYFIQWGIYGRDYYVKDVVAVGAAETLTAINYAFAGIADNLTCTSLDTFADWGKRFDASESVDGIGDTVTQPLKGNFNQLKKLKTRYPQIRVLISIGGWNDSDKFSAVALSANRANFVQSCVDMFINGQFAGGVTDPGVFDGIDIDWEYPGACGATCNWSGEDKGNFTELMKEFRKQLDATRNGLLLTAAMPAPPDLRKEIDLPEIANSVNWLNLMTYDFHGAWEPNGPTNHHANLLTNSSDPSIPQLSVKGVVSEYLTGGVPNNKLVIGIPFYGHGWARVADNGKHGLYQGAGSIPRGTWERGVDDYKVLKTRGYPEFWDDIAKASWLYNGSVFWTFDSPAAVREKMSYINTNGLKGVMFWELSGDDGTLIKAIADCLDASSQTCPWVSP
jgi:chitinase